MLDKRILTEKLNATIWRIDLRVMGKNLNNIWSQATSSLLLYRMICLMFLCEEAVSCPLTWFLAKIEHNARVRQMVHPKSMNAHV